MIGKIIAASRYVVGFGDDMPKLQPIQDHSKSSHKEARCSFPVNTPYRSANSYTIPIYLSNMDIEIYNSSITGQRTHLRIQWNRYLFFLYLKQWNGTYDSWQISAMAFCYNINWLLGRWTIVHWRCAVNEISNSIQMASHFFHISYISVYFRHIIFESTHIL